MTETVNPESLEKLIVGGFSGVAGGRHSVQIIDGASIGDMLALNGVTYGDAPVYVAALDTRQWGRDCRMLALAVVHLCRQLFMDGKITAYMHVSPAGAVIATASPVLAMLVLRAWSRFYMAGALSLAIVDSAGAQSYSARNGVDYRAANNALYNDVNALTAQNRNPFNLYGLGDDYHTIPQVDIINLPPRTARRFLALARLVKRHPDNALLRKAFVLAQQELKATSMISGFQFDLYYINGRFHVI